MDFQKWQKINNILERVLGLPEDERSAAILTQTREDPELRDEINQLFHADSRASDVLEKGVNAFLTRDKILPDLIDSLEWKQPSLERYKILKELGSGGMSIVYLAERTDGVFNKQVAIKVMKPFGINRKKRAQRLEAERQILARLDHPNIAGVYDGGLTVNGWPYLVMEVVYGIPITKYCTEKRLSIDERLRLFGQVCRAVHYAHQQLVVHRDLKPDNILVTGDGEVKLLDFGIARMLRDEENIMPMTRTGLPMLTPEYAAPEQFRGMSASTSVDVYSLGVLLYELLTGTRPFDFSGKSPAEVEQKVCEQEPVRPSERGKRPGRSRGDLDVICLKALHKEPEMRYNSVQELNDDLQRYLKGQPVTARPATIGYRIRKFTHRHRAGVTIAAIILIVLTGFILALIRQQSITAQERDRALTEAQKSELVTGFMIELFENANPLISQERALTVEELLDLGRTRAIRLTEQPEISAHMLNTIGTAYFAMGRLNDAFSVFQQQTSILREHFGDSHPEVATGINELGWIKLVRGDYSGSAILFNEAIALFNDHLNNHKRDLAKSLHGLSLALNGEGHLNSAEELMREAIEIRRQLLGENHADLAHAVNDMGIIMLAQGDYARSEHYFNEAITMRQNLYGNAHPLVAESNKHLANILRLTGRLEQSESTMEEVIKIQSSVLGDAHPDLAISYYTLARILNEAGRPEEAKIQNQKAIAIMQELEEHYHMLPSMIKFSAELHQTFGEMEFAATAYQQAATNCMDIHGINSYSCIEVNLLAGEFFFDLQELDKASQYLQHARDVMSEFYDSGHDRLERASSLLNLMEHPE